MSKQSTPQKRVKQQSRKNGKGPIKLDPHTLEIIRKESKFLALQPDEYCKLVMVCAQVLRESTVQTPLTDSHILRAIIDTPLLLSLVRSFATQYLSSTLSEVLQSQRNQSGSQSMSQLPTQPQPFPYPPQLPYNPYPVLPKSDQRQTTPPPHPFGNSSPLQFF
jgi:hypothetical protein